MPYTPLQHHTSHAIHPFTTTSHQSCHTPLYNNITPQSYLALAYWQYQTTVKPYTCDSTIRPQSNLTPGDSFMCSCCLIKRQKYIYISGIILTLLLPEYHLKTTDKNVKFDILKPFFFFLFSHFSIG